jgi:hypothetical protein
MASCMMKKEGFHNHMRDKGKDWEVEGIYMGDNYAVFTFKFKYKCDLAEKNVNNYKDYYGYRVETDGERLVIINTNGV